MAEIAKKMGERLGEEGYAFANINTVPQVGRRDKKVALNFVVDPGQAGLCAAYQFSGEHQNPR
jgi:outer membrane protein insertion porin family